MSPGVGVWRVFGACVRFMTTLLLPVSGDLVQVTPELCLPMQVVVFLQQHFRESGTAPGGISDALKSPALAHVVRSAATMNAVLTRRIDMLRPDGQLTLKVASVMGTKVGPRQLWLIVLCWACGSGDLCREAAVCSRSQRWPW